MLGNDYFGWIKTVGGVSYDHEMSISCESEDAVALLAQVGVLLDRLQAARSWNLPNAETLTFVKSTTSVAARIASVRLRAIREVHTRGTALDAGAPSTAAWIRDHCLERPGVAKRLVGLARALDERYDVAREALASGGLTSDHAQVIAAGLDALPESVDEPTLHAAEADLVANAAWLDPAELTTVACRVLASMLDPDGEKAFAAEDARLHEGGGLWLTRTDSGGWLIRGQLDPETGQECSVVLSALSKPHPSTETGPDPRTAAQRLADGFADMVALAHASPKLPTAGGERPTVNVLIPYNTLLGLAGAAPATYIDGTPMSAQTARRLACDGKILPIVLGTDSQPMDLGRTSYTPTAALRKAVLIRDHHRCGTPRCGGMPRHVHHIEHWRHGGQTCLDNLVALCGHCHRLTHTTNSPWTITSVPGGKPIFTSTGPAP